MTLRPGVKADSLTATQLRVALGESPSVLRPHLIRVVDEIPLSALFRPLSTVFLAEGLPKPGRGSGTATRRAGTGATRGPPQPSWTGRLRRSTMP